MTTLKAYKMDGLGNDFVIFDNRNGNISLSKDQIRVISDRKNIGCDQIILIEKDKSNNNTEEHLKFYNSDGSVASACGNGTRCVAYLLMKEKNFKKILLRSDNELLDSTLNKDGTVSTNIGKPKFKWDLIPLSKDCETMDHKNLKINFKNTDGKVFSGGFALSVGNPHVIFFINNFSKFNLKLIGPKIENHKFFPEKCNVTLAQVVDKNNISVNVWERGAGLTKACGTAACATAVAGYLSDLTENHVKIKFKEGFLKIIFDKEENILMTGPVSKIKKITINI